MLPTFELRYLFQGKLVLDTAMHLGGGKLTLISTDDPLVRTPEGHPFIPGSSFKGVFRSTVERIAGSVPGVKTCFLEADNGCGCIGPQGAAQHEFNRQRADNKWSDRELIDQLSEKLCDTCRLFGSPYMSSKIFFDDLYLGENEQAYTQIRDGVGIDRDSENAVDGCKFDYEVVSSGAQFNMRITLDNPNNRELALACTGLSEFMSGFAGIGGKKSSGLGRCRVEDLRIFVLDLREENTRSERLMKYLLGENIAGKMQAVDNVSLFLNEKIKQLFDGGLKDA